MIFKDITKPVLLKTLLEQSNKHIDMPCGGIGRCGKCKVIAMGKLSPLTPSERENLSEFEISQNIRLACQAYAEGTVEVNYSNIHKNFQGITFGEMPKFTPIPVSNEGYGIAIDIGTTTIAAYLYDLKTFNCIKRYSEANNQSRFGADVITRIEYCNVNGLAPMTKSIQNQIEEIISVICEDKSKIKQIVVTGNTTMLHFFEGLDAKTIAVSPFTPKSLFGYEKNGYFMPRCIASYVGADITCAILASNMLNSSETSLLIDIGTNGEMALWHNGEIKCCSTAAGPAFEGAGISCGMPGTVGAINTVKTENGKIEFTTIDNKPPKGICGSGLIDAVAVMIENKVVDETGLIAEEGHDFCGLISESKGELRFEIGNSGIYLTQKDIRQVQLAKSAVCAGIYTLLSECGIEDIDKLYIAGGFGSFINYKNAATIGLFPKSFVGKTHVIGNGAGTGASMILLNQDFISETEKIAQKAKVVELSTSPTFMDKYIECMMF